MTPRSPRRRRATTTGVLRQATLTLPSLKRAAALFIALALAKLALVVLRAADGIAPPAHPFAPFVLLFEDAWLTGLLLLADLGLMRLLAGRPRAATAVGVGLWVVAGAAVLWAAINVPVARLFSTPLTASMMSAVGGALADSALAYLGPGNVVGLLLPLVGFVVAARALQPRRVATALYALGATSLIGPLALASARTLGVHHNAVVALVVSAVPSGAPPVAPEHDLDLPSAGPSLDLRELSGRARGMNVIVVVLESTGARYLPAWRPPDDPETRDPMPNLARLVRHATLFDRIWTPYPESIKGLFAAQCGQYPRPETAALEHAAERLRARCLSTVLGEQGYATGLFHSGWFAYLGMRDIVRDRGFDVALDAEHIGGPARSSFGTDDRETARRLLAWLDTTPRDRPFYAVWMPIAGHHPYRAPGDAPRPFVERSERDAYLNDLAVADAALGVLMAGVAERGLAGDTLWVVYGDHGQAFQQHPGNFAHTLFLYEENLHVPLALVLPDRSPTPAPARRAPQRGTLVDLAPTVLDLLGLPADPLHDGRSLLWPTSPPAVAFTDHRALQVAVAHGDWKAILEGGRLELYDLATDPAEHKDKSLDEAARAERYRRYLGAWLDAQHRRFASRQRPLP
ncbi:MAG: sulfatase-like hydrolase/transferase [Deltaproteobacteria bacterium]|nr:sulfatase-like hydrolase/transferase [Deltaproteobacteria bacterium]